MKYVQKTLFHANSTLSASVMVVAPRNDMQCIQLPQEAKFDQTYEKEEHVYYKLQIILLPIVAPSSIDG